MLKLLLLEIVVEEKKCIGRGKKKGVQELFP
jgi:hypothetical protein